MAKMKPFRVVQQIVLDTSHLIRADSRDSAEHGAEQVVRNQFSVPAGSEDGDTCQVVGIKVHGCYEMYETNDLDSKMPGLMPCGEISRRLESEEAVTAISNCDIMRCNCGYDTDGTQVFDIFSVGFGFAVRAAKSGKKFVFFGHYQPDGGIGQYIFIPADSVEEAMEELDGLLNPDVRILIDDEDFKSPEDRDSIMGLPLVGTYTLIYKRTTTDKIRPESGTCNMVMEVRAVREGKEIKGLCQVSMTWDKRDREAEYLFCSPGIKGVLLDDFPLLPDDGPSCYRMFDTNQAECGLLSVWEEAQAACDECLYNYD